MSDLTYEYVNSIIKYDSLNGLFFRKDCKIKRFINKQVGKSYNNGHHDYVRISIDGKYHIAHRLAWLLYYGKWPENQIDHIDGNGLNNKISNLRDVSCSINGKNRKINMNNTSGRGGVHFNKRYERFQATAMSENKRHFLGYYNTFEEACDKLKDFHSTKEFTERHGKFTNI